MLPDVLPPPGAPFLVLFVGINPSLRSWESGHHFARPGNRFWPALHLAGFTPERFPPQRDGELGALGAGITNIASRPTRAAAELSAEELVEGRARLAALVRERAPRLVAILGVTAWRIATGDKKVQLGVQPEPFGGRPLTVLPNPSGLNANHQLPDLARLYGEARQLALSL